MQGLIAHFENTAPRESNVPPSPIVVKALNAVEALMAGTSWAPDKDLWAFSDVMRYAVPLALIGEGSTDDMRGEVRGALMRSGYMPSPKEAELFAAAILSRRMDRVQLLKESATSKMPDIRVVADSIECDVEVVQAQTKQNYRNALNLNALIQGALRPDKRDFSIIIHCAHDLSEAEQNDIVTAAANADSQTNAGSANRWNLRAVKPSEQLSETTPIWWSATETIVSNSVSFAEGVAGTRVVLCAPTADYTNPIERKAGRPQRTSEDKPYIIAYDVQYLANPTILIDQISQWFRNWPHVSGVLMFSLEQPPTYCDLTACFIPNPLCAIPAPPKFMSLVGTEMQSDLLDYEDRNKTS